VADLTINHHGIVVIAGFKFDLGVNQTQISAAARERERKKQI
jgi:hypothetical protein